MTVESLPLVSEGWAASRKIRRSVYELGGTPPAWRRAAKAARQAYSGDMFGASESPEGVAEQNRRWQEATGLKPQDSNFTIIVPIYNEEKYLPSMLASLLLSEIPGEVNLNVVLATNACTDKSVSLVEDFMGQLGKVQQRELDPEQLAALGDTGLSATIAETKVHNITFTHIDTQTVGKANVLTVGNALAVHNGHRVAIGIDANGFVEPEAIKIMFGRAYQGIVIREDASALYVGERQLTANSSLFTKAKKRVSHIPLRQEDAGQEQYRIHGIIHGGFIAWDTAFVQEVGGVPHGLVEDYALGLKAYQHDRTIEHVSGAGFFYYQESTLQDKIKHDARLVHGYLQVLANNPEDEAFIRGDLPIMGNVGERLKRYTSLLYQNPQKLPFLAAKFLLAEYGRMKGKRAYRRDPDARTWSPIASTKL